MPLNVHLAQLLPITHACRSQILYVQCIHLILLSKHELLQLPKCLLLVIINNNLVMNALDLGIFQLSLRLFQTLLDAFLLLRASAPQS